MAATRQQVKIFMSQREQGKTQAAAAAKAGISERTGWRLEGTSTRPAGNPRLWRTRTDPFAAVWDEVAQQLCTEPGLQALTLLEWLQERYPGQYPDKLLRTLQNLRGLVSCVSAPRGVFDDCAAGPVHQFEVTNNVDTDLVENRSRRYRQSLGFSKAPVSEWVAGACGQLLSTGGTKLMSAGDGR